MYRCRSYFSKKPPAEELINIYRLLFAEFGTQNWWPADSKLEVIIGAILTQAVSWKNVEKAIVALKEQGYISVERLKNIKETELAQLIKPAGYYNMKARKLKEFITFLSEKYENSLDKMFTVELSNLRKELLGVYGIGPETADSILLYAGEYPVFVVDNYTRRIFCRLGFVKKDIKYLKLQSFIENNLVHNVNIYNEYHALLVELAKNYCTKKEPDCQGCPLCKNN